MKRILFLVFTSMRLIAFGQFDAQLEQYGKLIKPEELKDNLTIIASDAMEGRNTGSRGQKMAAAFIAHHFQEIGLEPPVKGSYYQPVQLYRVKQGEVYMSTAGQTTKNYEGLLYMGNEVTEGEIKTDIVYIGQGRDEDLAQVSIQGKSVLLYFEKMNFQAFRDLEKTAASIRSKGGKYTFVVTAAPDGDFDAMAARMKNFRRNGSLTLTNPDAAQADPGVFYLSGTVAAKLFNTTAEKLKAAALAEASKKPLKKWKPAMASVQAANEVALVSTENVLGFLPGTDKKEEVLVITAHYDHIGKREVAGGDGISNGADDDGSGTVAVMQLAKVFAQAKKDGSGPRRSILFMTVTGEEVGLLGSEYYTNNPVFPLANTVVNLNMDMIGRSDGKYKDNKNYVYVIGADKLSSELHELNERLNAKHTKLAFDYVYNDESHPDRLYYRSDHWNFAKNNVPIIFYFDGIHEDYHKVSDEVSKIDFEQLALRAKCVFNTAWEIANRENRLTVDKK